MACGESDGHVIDTSRDPEQVKLVTTITPRAQYFENSWKCYLATITN